MIELNRRVTRKYVGTCQHLDKWEFVANADELANRIVSEDDDATVREVFILVAGYADDIHTRWVNAVSEELDFDKWLNRQTVDAITDTYSRVGCHCEHDCCGCLSLHATDAQRVTGDLWKVTVTGSRNY